MSRFLTHLGIALLSLVGSVSLAQEPKPLHVDIDAQPVGDALNQFAEQSGLQVVLYADDAEGIDAAPVAGEFSDASLALDTLLASTGLEYTFINDRTVAVTAAKENEAEDPGNGRTAPRPVMKAQASSEKNKQNSEHFSSGETQDNQTFKKKSDLPIEEIVVTGTHIPGLQNRTSPIIILGGEEIERSGYSTMQDLFDSLPQNFGGGQEGASEDGAFGSGQLRATNFTAGTAANLRGLGSSSTLVLLNGHRVAPTQFGRSVDLSLIPLSAVERVEVLTDGSSAIYGSDAIAGVVNIILRSDYSGAETRARFGDSSQGGREEQLFSQAFGSRWTDGGAMLMLQYQESDKLGVDQRDFGDLLPRPNDVLPASRNYGAGITARHDLTEELNIYVDALYTTKDVDRMTTVPIRSAASYANSDLLNLVTGLRWSPSESFSIHPSVLYSRNVASQLVYWLPLPQGETTLATDQRLVFESTSVDLTVEGRLPATAGGDIRVAAGGSYRQEDFEQNVTIPARPIRSAKRSVAAVFGEIYVPIVGEANRFSGVRALELSGAVRYDNYSDVGSTTNPRVGIYWSALEELGFRATYTRSFRAPNSAEKLSQDGDLFVLGGPRLQNPDGSGLVPTFLLVGGGREVSPEHAKTLSIGMDYKPRVLPDLSVSVNYYEIDFTDRIISPSFDAGALLQGDVYQSLITPLPDDAAAAAYLAELVAAGATFLGTTSAGHRYAFDQRQQNVSEVVQTGYDVIIDYRRHFDGAALSARAAATFINSIDTRLTPQAPAIDQAGTVGNPLNTRLRLDVGWSAESWSVNAAVNHADAYMNTTLAVDESIASWTTVDVTLRASPFEDSGVQFLKGTSFVFAVQNLFDEAPPFVRPVVAAETVAYDPANASPLGRFVSLELRKEW